MSSGGAPPPSSMTLDVSAAAAAAAAVAGGAESAAAAEAEFWLVCECLMDHVRRRGLHEPGIFRAPRAIEDVRAL
jgi:hypothetical protein